LEKPEKQCLIPDKMADQGPFGGSRSAQFSPSCRPRAYYRGINRGHLLGGRGRGARNIGRPKSHLRGIRRDDRLCGKARGIVLSGDSSFVLQLLISSHHAWVELHFPLLSPNFFNGRIVEDPHPAGGQSYADSLTHSSPFLPFGYHYIGTICLCRRVVRNKTKA
jgi:hypothetical protein